MNIFKIILLIGTLVGMLDTKGCPGDKAKALSTSFSQLSGVDAEELSVGDFTNFKSLPTVNSVQSEKQEAVVEDGKDGIIFEDENEEAQSDEPVKTARELSADLITIMEQALKEVQELADISSETDKNLKQTASELSVTVCKMMEIYNAATRAAHAFYYKTVNSGDVDSLTTLARSTELQRKINVVLFETQSVLYQLQVAESKANEM